MTLARRCAFLVCSAAAALGAQTTHTVQGGGAALQQAIAAAAPGDILDVLPGSYSPVTCTRGLRISLRAGAAITASSPSPGAAITVSALPLGDALVVEGGSVDGISASGCAGAVVGNRFAVAAFAVNTQISNCSGPVVFQQVTGPPYPGSGRIDIVNCAQVSFTSCALPRVTVTNSRVTFAQVRMLPYGGSLNASMPTVRLVSGSLSIAGGDISGGTAASWPFHESALVLEQGDLVVSGGARLSESQGQFTPPAVPAIATLGGTLRIDPSVILIGTPPISGPATVVGANVPSLAVTRAPLSTSFQLDVAAVPAGLVFTLIALPQPALPTPFGDIWMSPASPILDIVVMPQSGMQSLTRTFAGVPPFLVLALQSAALSPAGAIAVGVPIRFVWD